MNTQQKRKRNHFGAKIRQFRAYLLLLNKLVSDVKNPPLVAAGDSVALASAGRLGSAVGVDGARLLRCRGK